MNLDDKSLFLDAMEDVQPLKRNNDVHWHPGRNSRAPQRVDTLQLDNFLTTGYLDIVPLATPLEFKREGLQSGVLDKLRRGNTASRRASPCCASRWNSAGRCSSPLWCRRRKRGYAMC
ncbi:Probable DNA endonuclease SmrA [Klebsiella pneumoniae]|nr:Probable DNA endonuclease SmrA [Klebsiella pneumoniae]